MRNTTRILAALGVVLIGLSVMGVAYQDFRRNIASLQANTVLIETSLEVDGTTQLDGVTTINGAATFGSIAATTVTVSATLDVTGAQTNAAALTATGTITGIGTISGEHLNSTDDGAIADDFTVGGDATVTGTIVGIGAASVATTLTVTGGLIFPDTNDSYIIGIYTYSADPQGTTAALTATGVRAGDFILGGPQSGAANGTMKTLEGATPGTNVINMQWEVDPGAAVRYTFLVLRQ